MDLAKYLWNVLAKLLTFTSLPTLLKLLLALVKFHTFTCKGFIVKDTPKANFC